jgi:hypothetical protein
MQFWEFRIPKEKFLFVLVTSASGLATLELKSDGEN